MIQDKQFDRAWKTFASAKSNEQPDTILYTTMIKMCFETQECEKAIDLFTEMMELNIEANEKTFNALIKTCGSRSDYYEYCFELLEKMIVNGFELNLETFEILLTITARNGDRQRAYKVWNHFIEKVELEKINDGNIYAQEPIVVNSFIMTQMLKLFDSLMGKSSLANKDEEEIGTIDQSIIPADSILPKLDSRLAVVEDANRIWDCTLDLAEKGYLEINGSILLARLKFLAQLTKLNSDEPIRNALEFMNTEFSSRNIPIKGGAYKALLRGAMKHKQSYQVGLEIYNQFKEWDEKLERDLKQVFPNLTLQEYEKKRVDQSRSAKTMLDCLLIVARGHCRNGNLKEAVELVEQCRKFRYPYYLPPITLHQVNNILTECQREADNGNLENLEKLQQLLPPVHHNLVTKVQKVLKKKNVGLGWWGWKVILSDKERLEMHKRNQKERREREKRQQELRSKGEFHAANRAKMVQLFKGYVDKE